MSARTTHRPRLATQPRTIQKFTNVRILVALAALLFSACTISNRKTSADGELGGMTAQGGGGSDPVAGSSDNETTASGGGTPSGSAGSRATEGGSAASGTGANSAGGTAADSSSAGAAGAAPDGNVIGDPVPDGPCAALSGSAGGSGVAGTELCQVATSLSGLRWELKCTMPAVGVSCACAYTDTKVALLSGTPGTAYDIGLRFRGIVEQKTYLADPNATMRVSASASANAAGAADASAGAAGASAESAPSVGVAHGLLNANLFSVGGTPDDSPYNLYQLDVSDPKQTYFLNAGRSGSIYVFPIDYVVTIRANGGAKVTLTANSIEALENPNKGTDGRAIVVSGVPPAPLTYDGQFVQMDVESVTRAP